MKTISYKQKLDENNNIVIDSEGGFVLLGDIQEISYVKVENDISTLVNKYYDYYLYVRKSDGSKYLIECIKYRNGLVPESTHFVTSIFINYIYAYLNDIITFLPELSAVERIVYDFSELYDDNIKSGIERIIRWKKENKGNIVEPTEELQIVDLLMANWYRKY